MELTKGSRYYANYHETADGKYIVIKSGGKWEVWKRYIDKEDDRRSLTDGYSLEWSPKTLKDAKAIVADYYK